jgi:uncharacterized protein YneF (UPF0154 family)
VFFSEKKTITLLKVMPDFTSEKKFDIIIGNEGRRLSEERIKKNYISLQAFSI